MSDKNPQADGPAKLKIKKGDTVMVMAGKDGPRSDSKKEGGIRHGKTGVVLRAFPSTNKVLVEGVNLIIKHQKPMPPRPGQRAPQSQESGRITKPAPLDAAKVMLVCPHCKRPTRVGYNFKEGTEKPSRRKFRVCKHQDCGKSID
jgi:large subunit ribosomal protein L24